ncbi:hypothetical protein Tco_1477316, partial [Tanacetum coccineum]
DPADYPTNRDDDEEEEEESSKDDVDDKEEDKDEDKEEHLAPDDSVPPPACHTTARMSIQDQTPISFPSTAVVDIFLAISTPPSSPLTSYSSPLPQIPSPPIPVSSPLPMSPPPLPVSPSHPLGYRAAMIRLRAEVPSTSHPLPLPSPIILPHTRASIAMMRAAAPSTYILASRLETPPLGTPLLLPIPLPTSSPPLLLSSTDYRVDVPEDTNEIYGRLDDAQDDRSLMSGQINLLRRDRRAHARTARLMEAEARASREDWVQSMDASNIARFEKMAPKRTTRSTPTTTTTPTTFVTDEQFKRLIAQGVADVLAKRKATRSGNGEDSHDSGMGGRRQAPLARECTYLGFMK